MMTVTVPTKFCVDCANYKSDSHARVGMCVRGTKLVELVDPERGKYFGHEHSFVGTALEERVTGSCGMEAVFFVPHPFGTRPSDVRQSRSLGMSIIERLRKWRGK